MHIWTTFPYRKITKKGEMLWHRIDASNRWVQFKKTAPQWIKS